MHKLMTINSELFRTTLGGNGRWDGRGWKEDGGCFCGIIVIDGEVGVDLTFSVG